MTGSTVHVPTSRGLAAPRSVAWRVRQFIVSVAARSDETVDANIRTLLADDQLWSLIAALSPFDRSHHLSVHQELLERGYGDADLLLAALLHDIGKADHRGRAGVIGRTLRVLLRRFPPLLERLTREDHPQLFHSLYLAEHHARLGADRARALGVSERCCWLIAHHEERDLGHDPHLSALIAVDDAVIR